MLFPESDFNRLKLKDRMLRFCFDAESKPTYIEWLSDAAKFYQRTCGKAVIVCDSATSNKYASHIYDTYVNLVAVDWADEKHVVRDTLAHKNTYFLVVDLQQYDFAEFDCLGPLCRWGFVVTPQVSEIDKLLGAFKGANRC